MTTRQVGRTQTDIPGDGHADVTPERRLTTNHSQRRKREAPSAAAAMRASTLQRRRSPGFVNGSVQAPFRLAKARSRPSSQAPARALDACIELMMGVISQAASSEATEGNPCTPLWALPVCPCHALLDWASLPMNSKYRDNEYIHRGYRVARSRC